MNSFGSCWLKRLPSVFITPNSRPSATASVELQAGFEALGVQENFALQNNDTGDAYTIRFANNCYTISGGEAGLLYGAYALLQGLALGKSASAICGESRPTFARRMINHWDRMDGEVERGYSGRSIFFADNDFCYDPARVAFYARMLASVGLNTVSINNVNVNSVAVRLLTEEFLVKLADVAAIFRSYGVRLLLSVNYASPIYISRLTTANTQDETVKRWWRERADIVYRHIPDLAGFILKVDSEGQPGPFQYGLNHAEGANPIADALSPHGGILIWRAFVYNCQQDWRDRSFDRPKAAYDNYQPLDGAFADNVWIQVKNGPYDFQVREPVSPLLGATPHTKQALEFQLAQEYTGHQIDIYYMPPQWKEVLHFDTKLTEGTSRILDFCGNRISAIAAVTNLGNDANWTGHDFAAANLYAYGRMAWNPSFDVAQVTDDWIRLTYGGDETVVNIITKTLLRSRNVYEKYNTPLGLCWMVTEHVHYGPSPEGYEFARWGTYHRANREAIGIDRSAKGTGYAQQYAPEVAAMYDSMAACPEELLLFFHRVRYDHVLSTGKTLLQHIYDTHFEGYDEAEDMASDLQTLQGRIDEAAFRNITERMEKQLQNAREWRDILNTYFYRYTGIPDKNGRTIYE